MPSLLAYRHGPSSLRRLSAMFSSLGMYPPMVLRTTEFSPHRRQPLDPCASTLPASSIPGWHPFKRACEYNGPVSSRNSLHYFTLYTTLQHYRRSTRTAAHAYLSRPRRSEATDSVHRRTELLPADRLRMGGPRSLQTADPTARTVRLGPDHCWITLRATYTLGRHAMGLARVLSIHYETFESFFKKEDKKN